ALLGDVTSAYGKACADSGEHSMDFAPSVRLPATVPVTSANTIRLSASRTSAVCASAIKRNLPGGPAVSTTYSIAKRGGASAFSVPANTTSLGVETLVIEVGVPSGLPAKSVTPGSARSDLARSTVTDRTVAGTRKRPRLRTDDEAHTTGFVPPLRTRTSSVEPWTGSPSLTCP